MIQRFIELGEGYSDIYELIDIAEARANRVHRLIRLDTNVDGKNVISLAVALTPIEPGHYMPIYFCREGIPNPDEKMNQRYELFSQLAKTLQKPITQIEVKPSTVFEEKTLYYQYLTGVLRLNHFIPSL
ncbi:MAG TPA: methylthioribose kinase [Bacilli bacterium]|nr:methylthioribose kinase [Bacilli bacterium]